MPDELRSESVDPFHGNRVAAVAWLAGVFEGEGSFQMSYGKAKSIKIDMTDRDVVERLQRTFGGSVWQYTPKNTEHKPWWRWCATTAAAEELVRDMLPFLGERRSLRAQEFLDEREARKAKRESKLAEVEKRRQRVRHLRGQGRTQAEIAAEVGLERSTVAHILRGRYDTKSA